jgi:hypothetical protein
MLEQLRGGGRSFVTLFAWRGRGSFIQIQLFTIPAKEMRIDVCIDRDTAKAFSESDLKRFGINHNLMHCSVGYGGSLYVALIRQGIQGFEY